MSVVANRNTIRTALRGGSIGNWLKVPIKSSRSKKSWGKLKLGGPLRFCWSLKFFFFWTPWIPRTSTCQKKWCVVRTFAPSNTCSNWDNFCWRTWNRDLGQGFDHWTNGLWDTQTSVTKYAIWMFVCSVGSCPVLWFKSSSQLFFFFSNPFGKKKFLKVRKVIGQDTSLNSVEKHINTKILFLLFFLYEQTFLQTFTLFKVSVEK